MILGVPREVVPGERRIALVPESVARLVQRGNEVVVELGPLDGGPFGNRAYEEAGAKLEGDARAVFERADLVAKIHPPQERAGGEGHEVDGLREGAALVGLLFPHTHLDAVRRLRDRRVSAFSLDLLPRITRAQSMDVLSSQSTISGYKAVLVAADALAKVFPLMMTAAGTLKPARVLVLGAGVAGLQAIATARRLGAVVSAYDVRAAAKEQVESLGARFVEDPAAEDAEGAGGYAREQTDMQQARQRALLARHVAESDVVITTALVPGKRAPVLLEEDQVRGMRPGSLIVDLAAEQGGNCTLTVPGEVVDAGGVRIHGPLNLPAQVPDDASRMFSHNVATFLAHVAPEGTLRVDLEDEITRGTLVTHGGAIVHEEVRAAAERERA